jgi:hypothetical protein
LIAFVTAGPSACTHTANVLSSDVDEEEEEDSLEVSDLSVFGNTRSCQPATTCVHQCNCGRTAYIDLLKHQYWNHLKHDFHRRCPSKMSMKAWFDGQINQGFREAGGYNKDLECVILKKFNTLVQQYSRRCSGSQRTSASSMLNAFSSLRLFSRCLGMRFRISWNKKRIGEEIAHRISDRFIHHLRSRDFEYCSCEIFKETFNGNRDLHHHWNEGMHHICHETCRFRLRF